MIDTLHGSPHRLGKRHVCVRPLPILALLVVLLAQALPAAAVAAAAPPVATYAEVPAAPLVAALPRAPLAQTPQDVVISVEDGSAVEGNPITLTASADAIPSGVSVEVDYATVEETARAGEDFVAQTGTITFTSTITSRTITIQTLPNDEFGGRTIRFFVELSNPRVLNDAYGAVNDVILDNGSAVIEDDDPEPVVQIVNGAQDEPDSGETNILELDVRLSNASAQLTLVSYELAPCNVDNCAEEGVDFEFVAADQMLSISRGAVAESIEIRLLGNDEPQPDRVLFVQLTDADGATIDTNQRVAQGTIRDNDVPVARLSSDTFTTTEDAGSALITVTLNFPPSAGDSTRVQLEPGGGTATQDTDYQAPQPATMVFNSGDELTRTFALPLINNDTRELSETVLLTLTAISNVTLGEPGQAILTIIDDDEPPAFAVETNTPTVDEGGPGSTSTAVFNVQLSAESLLTQTVQYSMTLPPDVQAGVDYTLIDPLRGELEFLPGETQQTVSIDILGNDVDEVNRTYTIDLSNPVGDAIIDPANASAFFTVVDDDGPDIFLTQESVTIVESNRTLTFEVRLSEPSVQAVQVAYDTNAITATAAIDYQAANGTLTFPAGSTSQTFEVATLDDYVIDGDKTFEVELTNPTNGQIIPPNRVVITMTDNEGPPQVRFRSPTYTVTENMTLTVTMEAFVTTRPDEPIGVLVRTEEVSATEASDYVGFSDVITFDLTSVLTPVTDIFTPTTLTSQFTITTRNDTFFEENEQFLLKTSNVFGGELADPSEATVTIVDDDPPPTFIYMPYLVGPLPRVEFGLANYNVNESNGQVGIDVSLDATVRTTSTVTYRTIPNTAQAGSDFVAASGVLTFTPDMTMTTQLITITILNDSEQEGGEQFIVALSNPTRDIQLGDRSSTNITIIDDDGLAVRRTSMHPLALLRREVGVWGALESTVLLPPLVLR